MAIDGEGLRRSNGGGIQGVSSALFCVLLLSACVAVEKERQQKVDSVNLAQSQANLRRARAALARRIGHVNLRFDMTFDELRRTLDQKGPLPPDIQSALDSAPPYDPVADSMPSNDHYESFAGGLVVLHAGSPDSGPENYEGMSICPPLQFSFHGVSTGFELRNRLAYFENGKWHPSLPPMISQYHVEMETGLGDSLKALSVVEKSMVVKSLVRESNGRLTEKQWPLHAPSCP